MASGYVRPQQCTRPIPFSWPPDESSLTQLAPRCFSGCLGAFLALAGHGRPDGTDAAAKRLGADEHQDDEGKLSVRGSGRHPSLRGSRCTQSERTHEHTPLRSEHLPRPAITATARLYRSNYFAKYGATETLSPRGGREGQARVPGSVCGVLELSATAASCCQAL